MPGLTTKMLASTLTACLSALRTAAGTISARTGSRSPGTPVRGEFGCETKEQAKAELGIPAGEKLVVSVGAPLGAGHMNEVMTELIPMLDGMQGFRLLHAARRRYYTGMAEKLR